MQFLSPFFYIIVSLQSFFSVEEKFPNPHEFVCYHVTRCTASKAKTLGLKHLQFPEVGVSGRPPDGPAYHDWADDLLAQQNSVPYRETTHVYERTHHSLSLSHFISHLIYMGSPGQPCIKGHA
jgi:hypothetical protein